MTSFTKMTLSTSLLRSQAFIIIDMTADNEFYKNRLKKNNIRLILPETATGDIYINLIFTRRTKTNKGTNRVVQ